MLTVRFNRLGLKHGDWVLDLGCGAGRHVHGLHMLDQVNAIGADLDEAALKQAREGLLSLGPARAESALVTRFDRADALQLPYETASFDVVICSEVLEHVGPYDDLLSEIRRVLKPAGRLVVSVPRAWPERLCWRLAPPPGGYAHEPGGHIRIFDPVDLKYSIINKGFSYQGRHFAHALHSPFWWLKCLFWSRRDEHRLIRLYHRLLVWDLMKRPWVTRALEALLNPIMGKSLVLYFGPARHR
jgi:SAM-dependent methyltransferase